MADELLAELKRMSKLLALNLTKDLSTNEKYFFLSQADYQPKEIAEIFGTTANTVRVALSKSKKARKKK